MKYNAYFLSVLLFTTFFIQSNFLLKNDLLLDIVELLKKDQPVIFTKFGDGEYNCMRGISGHNCDGDNYNPWMGKMLKESLLNLSKKPNTYIGIWHTQEVITYYEGLARSVGVTIPWVAYHLIYNDDHFFENDYLYRFVSQIIQSKKKKILICNKKNERLKNFFNADVFIPVPEKNWSYSYSEFKKVLFDHVEEDAIILIAAGMCSKILIADVTDSFKVSCFDIGSGFDLLASKQKSRPWKHNYQDEYNYYKNLLPMGWD